ncbi:hypothetical protein BGZ46_003862, partial [Entomortierella lignicola]
LNGLATSFHDQTLTSNMSKLASVNDSFCLSEWSPKAAQTMCKEIRDMPAVRGLKIGDLIDATPKELKGRYLGHLDDLEKLGEIVAHPFEYKIPETRLNE